MHTHAERSVKLLKNSALKLNVEVQPCWKLLAKDTVLDAIKFQYGSDYLHLRISVEYCKAHIEIQVN